jgi:hypothetical protein
MRPARFAVMLVLALALLYVCSQAQTKEEKLTLTGKLTRAIAIGAETTGWTIDLDSETTIAGKAVHAIEITYSSAEKLEKLANQRVRAKGKIGHRHGVETGDRVILEVSSIKAMKAD